LINSKKKKQGEKFNALKDIQNIFLFNKKRNIPVDTAIWYVAASYQLISSEDLYRQYSLKLIDANTLFRPADLFQFSFPSEAKPLSFIEQENWTDKIIDCVLLKYTHLFDEMLKLKSLNETLDLNQQSIAKHQQSEIKRFVDETEMETENKQEQRNNINIVQEVDEEENKFIEVNKNKKKSKKETNESMYLIGMNKQQNKVEKKEPQKQVITPKVDINPDQMLQDLAKNRKKEEEKPDFNKFNVDGGHAKQEKQGKGSKKNFQTFEGKLGFK